MGDAGAAVAAVPGATGYACEVSEAEREQVDDRGDRRAFAEHRQNVRSPRSSSGRCGTGTGPRSKSRNSGTASARATAKRSAAQQTAVSALAPLYESGEFIDLI